MRHATTPEGTARIRTPRRLVGWLTALALGAAVNGGACFVHELEDDTVHQRLGGQAALDHRSAPPAVVDGAWVICATSCG